MVIPSYYTAFALVETEGKVELSKSRVFFYGDSHHSQKLFSDCVHGNVLPRNIVSCVHFLVAGEDATFVCLKVALLNSYAFLTRLAFSLHVTIVHFGLNKSRLLVKVEQRKQQGTSLIFTVAKTSHSLGGKKSGRNDEGYREKRKTVNKSSKAHPPYAWIVGVMKEPSPAGELWVSMLFLLAFLVAPPMLVLAAPFGAASTYGLYPKSVPFNLHGSLGFRKYGVNPVYSTGFIGARSGYLHSAKTAHLIKSLKAQIGLAAKKGFAAGAQAGLASALGAAAHGPAGYPGAAVVPGYTAGVAAHGGAYPPGVAVHGGAYPAGVAVHGGAYPAGVAVHGPVVPGYPGGAAAVHGVPGYPGGATVEEVRVGGVPVSQKVHSLSVAKVPVAGPHGVGVAKVPVSTKTVHALGAHGLPVTKTVQQVGGLAHHGPAAAYAAGVGGVHGKAAAVHRATSLFGRNRGFSPYGNDTLNFCLI
ncbi:hypothetical protein BaRGS_00022898 [Batillaria attramentaria]|uniref:Uncharacterized protein n=1 Tax=Batillaria attramentaria TaxID=370345 RepID=A0ABD0KF96_9CAEN